MVEIRFEPKYLEDGVQCSHPGCIAHVSHPCEGCGRIQSNNYLTIKYYIKLLKVVKDGKKSKNI